MKKNVFQKNLVLADKTSYRIGGPADFYKYIENTEDLRAGLQYVKDNRLDYFILGAGTNLLISDRGFRGAVFDMRGMKGIVRDREDDRMLRCRSGESLHKVVRFCAEAGLKGVENLSGIPGTVGGAVVMNAGSFGTEFSDILRYVDVYDPVRDEFIRLTGSDIRAGYRYSVLQDNGCIVTAAELRLDYGETDELKQRCSSVLSMRRERQPLEFPTCGSVFKRPEEDSAGRIIQECGLKGYSRGRAKVSEKHANFILNTGGASAEDVRRVISVIKERAQKEFEVKLEPEVIFVGDFYED